MTVLERPTVDNGVPIGSLTEAALVVWWMASWIAPAPAVSMVHLYLLERLSCQPCPLLPGGGIDWDTRERQIAAALNRPTLEQGSLW